VEIDEQEYKSVEECVIILSQHDFLKRVNQKSYQKSAPADGEVVKCILPSATDMRVQIFTSAGNLYTLPTLDIPECKLRDKGKPLSALLAGIAPGESIVGIFSVSDYTSGAHLFFATRSGLIKRSSLAEYDVRNKKIVASGLSEGDSIIAVHMQRDELDWMAVTRSGLAIRFPSTDVSVMGRSAKGVKCIQLQPGDSVVMAAPVTETEDVALFTDLGYAKLTRVSNFEPQRRGGKGIKAISFLKNGSTGSAVAAAFPICEPCGIVATLKSGQCISLSSEQLERQDRAAKGTPAVLAVLGDTLTAAGKSFLS
jgi:DNA gyrase subunit A